MSTTTDRMLINYGAECLQPIRSRGVLFTDICRGPTVTLALCDAEVNLCHYFRKQLVL